MNKDLAANHFARTAGVGLRPTRQCVARRDGSGPQRRAAERGEVAADPSPGVSGRGRRHVWTISAGSSSPAKARCRRKSSTRRPAARELGVEFLDELVRIEGHLRANPALYQRVDGEVRRAVLRRFPYGLFYVVDDGQVNGAGERPRLPSSVPRPAVARGSPGAIGPRTSTALRLLDLLLQHRRGSAHRPAAAPAASSSAARPPACRPRRRTRRRDRTAPARCAARPSPAAPAPRPPAGGGAAPGAIWRTCASAQSVSARRRAAASASALA